MARALRRVISRLNQKDVGGDGHLCDNLLLETENEDEHVGELCVDTVEGKLALLEKTGNVGDEESQVVLWALDMDACMDERD